jgi:protein pelota
LKVLKRALKKGLVRILPENLDDLWHLYNIIFKNDEVYARTTREVKTKSEYARPKEGKRISISLGIKVGKIIWDRSLNRLRVHGIVCEAPDELSVKGSRHTLSLFVNQPVTIKKTRWPKHCLDRLRRASQSKSSQITLISIDDEEYSIAVLTQYGLEVTGNEKTRLPGKLEAEKRTKAMFEFFQRALQILRRSWTETRGRIVVIGPGFIKNSFVKYVKETDSNIALHISDVKGVNASGLGGIYEALRSGVLTKTFKNIRVLDDFKIVEEILSRLGKGRLDVTYGLNDVKKASFFGATNNLILADTALREVSNEERLALEEIIKKVEEKGGNITIVSTEHEAGEKLLALGGIAALLRFPIFDQQTSS